MLTIVETGDLVIRISPYLIFVLQVWIVIILLALAIKPIGLLMLQGPKWLGRWALPFTLGGVIVVYGTMLLLIFS
jgi:hypothetical protein